MNANAVPQEIIKTRRTGAGAIVLAVAGTLLLGAFTESAAAAPLTVGKEGQVYACYKAKGKRKGNVRLVGKSARCRRGERKASWAMTGPPGPAGQNGSSGLAGAGAAGALGLEAKVADLTQRLAALEGVLKGVTNEALTKALDTVKGITNLQLQETVAALTDVDALCKQTAGLVTQVNGLGLSLGGVLTTLAALLPGVPGVPLALPPFSCNEAT